MMQYRPIVVTLGLSAALALVPPATAREKDREHQGAASLYKHVADMDMRITYKNDITSIALSYDVNPTFPLASLYCWGAQVVEPNSTQRYKRYRSEAAILYAEGQDFLGTVSGRYKSFDYRTEYPQITLLAPDFDRDIYTWRNPAIYSETEGGVPLAQIHSTTAGNIVYYFADISVKGRESEDDLVLNYCGIFNGTSYTDVRRELGRMLLLQAVTHFNAERPDERPRD